MQTPRITRVFYALGCIGQFGTLEEESMKRLKLMLRKLLRLPATKSKGDLQKEQFDNLMNAMKDFEDMYKKL